MPVAPAWPQTTARYDGDTVEHVGKWSCTSPYIYVRPVMVRTPSGEYVVRFEWRYTGRPLHRPTTSGISVGDQPQLGRRLCSAVEAGLMFDSARVIHDVYGASYVEATQNFHGRGLAADLTRAGL